MYREVCSTCHSIKFVAFRNLIGVSHTEAEVRRTGSDVVVLAVGLLTLAYLGSLVFPPPRRGRPPLLLSSFGLG